ncbi:unnamed protein product [Phytomonas sp. Hart1]|nr:unnamed protein product [Phytomonas sp. Hart1]|eukprot:CCW70273.1 unnamed protein product [Phytomonas sp. isolate Hart1]
MEGAGASTLSSSVGEMGRGMGGAGIALKSRAQPSLSRAELMEVWRPGNVGKGSATDHPQDGMATFKRTSAFAAEFNWGSEKATNLKPLYSYDPSAIPHSSALVSGLDRKPSVTEASGGGLRKGIGFRKSSDSNLGDVGEAGANDKDSSSPKSHSRTRKVTLIVD